jgi:hypothetical protein
MVNKKKDNILLQQAQCCHTPSILGLEIRIHFYNKCTMAKHFYVPSKKNPFVFPGNLSCCRLDYGWVPKRTKDIFTICLFKKLSLSWLVFGSGPLKFGVSDSDPLQLATRYRILI